MRTVDIESARTSWFLPDVSLLRPDGVKGVKHTAFQVEFVWLALIAALGAGFPIGAHLSFVLGFGFPPGAGFGSFVQTHGHIQLLGWTGLFIMGISLHFVPRLAGVPLARPRWLRRILWLMGIGLGLRCVLHATVPYLKGSPAFIPAVVILVGTGVLEAAGILHYVSILVATMRSGRGRRVRPALLSVRPYLGMMLIGWVVYAGLNVFLLLHMALRQSTVVDAAWNRFAVDSFIGLVLLPVSFAFSVRTFPLYLRLAAPRWSVRGVAYGYAVALVLRLVSLLPWCQQAAPDIMLHIGQIGTSLRGGVILWFVWRLDVLTRRRAPWTVHRRLQPAPDRRATRPGLPDYGEFGRFERLVYAAYGWLLAAALGEFSAGPAALLGWSWWVGDAAIRHMYLAGFITLLIFGMAVRMIPGFLQKKQVASPAQVEATFWLGNAAAICRVLLFVLPAPLFDILPGIFAAARIAFAVSGLFGIAAVLCLALNLWKTAKGA